MQKEYKCPKCGCTSYEKDTISTTGSGLSKFIDVQNRKFTAISCTNCKYTEFYKGNDMGVLSQFLDFLST